MKKITKNNKPGRPVDLLGINIKEIEEWLSKTKLSRKIIICQSIIALSKGVPMAKVSHVLGVTREGMRLWKGQLRTEGLNGVLKEKKVGKRSKLDPIQENELKEVSKRSPRNQGYLEKKWTGRLVQNWVYKKWGYNISIRSAQMWLAKVV